MSFQKTITKEEIEQLKLKNFDGKIHIIDSEESFNVSLPLMQKATVLGFDTETKPVFKKGQKRNKVALLQLSTVNDAFLIKLNEIGLPNAIRDILANPKVLKVGVAIAEDARLLQQHNQFKANGFFELQTYVKEFGIENFSLKKLVAIVLNFQISKKQQISNWEKIPLTKAQELYAATDAWAGILIYNKLIESLTK